MNSLPTVHQSLELVPPDPERDTPFAMQWFTGNAGKQTLLLMGNPEHTITPTSYEKEYGILSSFVEMERSDEQLTWMMCMDDKTIGAIWVELKDSEYLAAPAISVMIGNPEYRGRGLGKIAMNSVIDFLKQNRDFSVLYARRLVNNTGSAALLDSLGFVPEGEVYTDTDNLTFQNFQLSLR